MQNCHISIIKRSKNLLLKIYAMIAIKIVLLCQKIYKYLLLLMTLKDEKVMLLFLTL